MSSSGSTPEKLTGSTSSNLQERLRPLNAILEQSNGRWKLVDPQVRDIQKDLTKEYYQERDTTGPLNLTLGVEIEGILLRDTTVPTKWSGETENGISAVKWPVHHALSQPLTKHCTKCGRTHQYQIPLNYPCADDCDLDYDKWTIGYDGTVGAKALQKEYSDRVGPRGKQFKDHAFEIRSRVMGDSKTLFADTTELCSHQPEITYQEEIRGVYRLLADAFLNPARDEDHRAWRLMVDKSCGLHVHIGNGSVRLPLETVKNVFSLYTANERQIDNMHSRDRISGSTLILNPTVNSSRNGFYTYTFQDVARNTDVYNGPLSAHFAFMAYANRANVDYYKRSLQSARMTPYPNRRFESDPALKADSFHTDANAWLNVIHKAPQVDYLRDLQARTCHYSTVNLENMAPIELRSDSKAPAVKVEHSKNTIEFRQAAGTLDSNATLAWVDFLVKLVEYSHSKPSSAILAECQAVLQDVDHTTLDFLSSLGFDRKDPTFVHYKHVGPWCAPEKSYSNTLLSSELALANSFGSNDSMAEFMSFNSRKLCEELSVDAVNERIEDKFLHLGYGQFEKTYIEALAHEEDWPVVKSEWQQRLIIGWTATLPSTSSSPPPGDDDDDDDDDEDSSNSSGGGRSARDRSSGDEVGTPDTPATPTCDVRPNGDGDIDMLDDNPGSDDADTSDEFDPDSDEDMFDLDGSLN